MIEFVEEFYGKTDNVMKRSKQKGKKGLSGVANEGVEKE